ncbi:phage holin, partial [Listeria monocytogenes]|nr:phage holin [Listeria monocytogenes]
LVQQVLGWFGVTIPADTINKEALDMINSVFLLLGVLGVVNDPTTPTASDSDLVLNKNKNVEDEV